LMHRIKVDFPEPDNPMMIRNSPGRTENEISFRARVPSGYVFERCSMRTAAPGIASP
jgi:hypothetical protein